MSTQGPIIAYVLDNLMFSRRVRNEIMSLKEKKDFREEGVLYVLKKWALFSVACIMISFSFIFLADPSYSYLIFVFIFCIWAVASFEFVDKAYYLPTKGLVCKGVITDVLFSPIPYIGWSLEYKYSLNKSHEHNGSFAIYNFMHGKPYNNGDVVVIVVDPEYMDKSRVLRGRYDIEPCLSKSRYDNLQKLKARGGV